MEAVLLIGIQATGKSSFFRHQFGDTHVRINLDMLKTRHRESILLNACLEMKQPFVVDNTNPTPNDRARYILAAQSVGFRSVGYYFESKIDDALARNAQREGHARIAESGILATYSRMRLPTLREGFDSLNYVAIDKNGGFIVEDWQDEV